MFRLISAAGVDEPDLAADALASSALGGFCGIAPHAAEIIEKTIARELFLQSILTIK
jgi:hypothetical protein